MQDIVQKKEYKYVIVNRIAPLSLDLKEPGI